MTKEITMNKIFMALILALASTSFYCAQPELKSIAWQSDLSFAMDSGKLTLVDFWKEG